VDTQEALQNDVVEVEIDSFNLTNKVHKVRVRQEIVKVACSAILDDLRDPNLTTIKRLMHE